MGDLVRIVRIPSNRSNTADRKMKSQHLHSEQEEFDSLVSLTLVPCGFHELGCH